MQKGRAASSVRLEIPGAVSEIARRLRQLPGVICVGWGSRRRKEVWTGEMVISVHVEKKRTCDELGTEALPRKIGDYEIDVLEVGSLATQSLSVRDPVQAAGIGSSTVTILGRQERDALAIVSGHGVLAAPGWKVRLLSNGQTYSGDVDREAGGFGGGLAVDWAMVRFRDCSDQVDSFHPASDGYPPLALTEGVGVGEQVFHYSSRRGVQLRGIFCGLISGHVPVGSNSYSGLLWISPEMATDEFSLPGDSGSLVVDEHRRAIGAIVGGSSSLHLSYAYDARRLQSVMDEGAWELFFKEVE